MEIWGIDDVPKVFPHWTDSILAEKLYSLYVPASTEKKSFNQIHSLVQKLDCVLFGSSEKDFLRYFYDESPF